MRVEILPLALAPIRVALLSLALAAAVPSDGRAAPGPSPLPSSETPFEPTRTTLIWLGTGLAHVHAEGRWQRVPSHDYEFSVTQRRYAERWESIKVQHRRHPAYDGSAGPRDQVHYFRVDQPAAATAGEPRLDLKSSFGDGTGRTDREFRRATLEFAARGADGFWPYNHFRITQHYRYEAGELAETVDLFKRNAGAEVPFMRFEERALLFAPRQFNGPPDPR